MCAELFENGFILETEDFKRLTTNVPIDRLTISLK